MEEKEENIDHTEVLMNLRPKTIHEMYLWQKSFIQELFGLLKRAEREIDVLKSEVQEAMDLQEPSKVRVKLKNVNIERSNLVAQNKSLKRKNEELLERIRKYEQSATTAFVQ
jgi:hypothetical protein